jgi:putative membrane protein
VEATAVGLPPYHVHPDTLLFCTIVALAYVFGLVHLGRPKGLRATRSQKLLFFAGLSVFYLAVSWPLHDVSDDYLYSAHMVQHVLLLLVVPPLLLWGIPSWLVGRVLPGPALRVVRKLARPIPATLIYNAVVAISHWPLVVDLMSRSTAVHSGMHLLLVVAATVMWLPVFSPTPLIRRLSAPGQMLYLFVQSILPTVPASFFTFAQGVIVPFYGDAPRLFGISVLADQQLAGFVMKVVGGLVIWTYIAVIFFRWYAAEGHESGVPAKFRGGGDGGTKPAGGSPFGPEQGAVDDTKHRSEKELAARR